MVSENIFQLDIIKRGGALAVFFLVATVALVIAQAQPANALLGDLLGSDRGTSQPTQERGLLAPVSDTVDTLVNKDTGLVPAVVDRVTDTTGEVLPNTTRQVKNILSPVTNDVLPGVGKLVDRTTEGADRLTNPVTEPANDVLSPVTEPVNQVVNGLSDTLRPNGVTPDNQNPAPTVPDASEGDGKDNSSANKSDKSSDESKPEVAGARDSMAPVEPENFFGAVGSFFSSALPSSLQNLANTVIGKEVGILPIAVSALLFLVMLGSIVLIVHTSNHGGVLTLGRLGTVNLSRFMRGHDLAQIASFAIVITGLGVISIYLTLTVL